MNFNYIATRKVDDITQAFVFNLENLNKTPADIASIATEADAVITAITNLDNTAWTSGSVVKQNLSTTESEKVVSDWKAAVDATIILRNYNATGKAKYYYRKVDNIATSTLVTQINTFISNIGTGLSTNNFYVIGLIINEHI